MARKDWINVGITSFLIETIDSFLKSEGAKIRQIDNRQQFVNKLLIAYFANYRDRTGINHFPPLREVKTKPPPGLLDFGPKRPKNRHTNQKTITKRS